MHSCEAVGTRLPDILLSRQYKDDVHHICACRPCGDKVSYCFEKVIGVVSGKIVPCRQAKFLCGLKSYARSHGTGSVSRAVSSVSACGKDENVVHSFNVQGCSKGKFLVASAGPGAFYSYGSLPACYYTGRP